jgi:riboflavin synthase alpha subunit
VASSLEPGYPVAMFTGIIETTGKVKSVRKTAKGIRVEVDRPWPVPAGASVAVNGVCLSALEGDRLAFDLVPETLSRSTLGGLRPGVRVNLERAMEAGARLDGHIVQGHVDGKGVVESLARKGGAVTLAIRAPGLMDQIVSKGSITVDGVSLTVVEAANGRFTVALIPTTLRVTTLGRLRKGDAVNIETDVLAKYARKKPTVTLALLKKAGFA